MTFPRAGYATRCVISICSQIRLVSPYYTLTKRTAQSNLKASTNWRCLCLQATVSTISKVDKFVSKLLAFVVNKHHMCPNATDKNGRSKVNHLQASILSTRSSTRLCDRLTSMFISVIISILYSSLTAWRVGRICALGIPYNNHRYARKLGYSDFMSRVADCAPESDHALLRRQTMLASLFIWSQRKGKLTRWEGTLRFVLWFC